MRWHIIAFFTGFIIDLIVGDPHSLPHPVVYIGRLIAFLDRKLLGEKITGADSMKESQNDLNDKSEESCEKSEYIKGLLTALIVIGVVEAVVIAVLFASYHISPMLGCAVEAVMTAQLLAARSLKVESMKVYDALENSTLEDARLAVSMIVGRDTASLSDEGVTKAAVETVAENTSDGVIAPMLYLAIGGPALGFIYKSINTMDSMIGYKNDRYMNFGRFAARLDDVVNFIPARISGWLLIAAATISGREFSGTEAKRIFLRDRFNHASPNSAQTESACAGALGVRLAGPASYFGVVKDKPYIGDDSRPVEHDDIPRTCRLMYTATFICEAVCLAIMAAVANIITLL